MNLVSLGLSAALGVIVTLVITWWVIQRDAPKDPS